MLHDRLNTERARAADMTYRQGNKGLQVVLWILWTLSVVATGYLSWHADMLAHQPTNMLGLVIHCVTVGAIGLVVLTKIEMWLEPWRFLDR